MISVAEAESKSSSADPSEPPGGDACIGMVFECLFWFGVRDAVHERPDS